MNKKLPRRFAGQFIIDILPLALLLIGGSLYLGYNQGFFPESFGKPLALAVLIAGALTHFFRKLMYIVKEGNKDVREIFGFKKNDNEKELRKWEQGSEIGDDEVLEKLSPDIRERIAPLEEAYIKEPNSKTTLELAQIYEECGSKDLAKAYYDQLSTEFKWTKETRELRKNNQRFIDKT